MATINQHPAFASLNGGGGNQKPKDIVITDSSFLQMFRYDAHSMQLTVVFKNGAEYIHSMVYGSTVEQLQESQNKSEFYLKQIKGKSPSTRIVDKNVGPNSLRREHGNHRSQGPRSKPRATGHR